MFIQVIKAKAKDEQGIRSALEEWQTQLAPGAEGYLGSTGGVCEDGTFLGLARFDSKDTAMRNSGRPEQGEWWSKMSANFDGDAEFIELDDVSLWMDGGSDDAGFVQVMIGQSPDVEKLLAGADEATDALREARPEIIGGTYGRFGDKGYVQTVYFRSESAAREKEGSEPPEDLREMVEERMRLVGDVSYYDLHQPIIFSKR